MPIIVMSIAFLLIFIISMIYEPRNFWNAPLLLMVVGFWTLNIISKPGVPSLILGIILMMTPLFFLIAAIFLIINGFVMMKKEGRRLQNILSLLTGIAMVMGGILTIGGAYHLQEASILRTLFSLVLCLEFYVAMAFVALLMYSILYTCLPKRINCDYIIIHGCGLINGERVSPLLKGRVDKAVRIYNKSKNKPKLVVSGGKGGDEKISEAEAMRNYLVETGFNESNIILEDKSKTTYENLKFTKEMLDTDGIKHKYIFVTNNYHVFRTSLCAKKLRMRAQGVGCRTAAYYWPSAFIREYIAMMLRYKWIFAAIVLLWGAIVAAIHM